MTVSRRDFLRASAAAGALLLSAPRIGWSGPRVQSFGVPRASKLFPGDGTFVVHSDLHNHSVFSDGAGTASQAFAKMRDAGLDVAAVTDHAIMGRDHDVCAQRQPCTIAFGISDKSWRETGAIADAANADGQFVALRGFEWSTGSLGHANVWFTPDWIDPLNTGSLIDPKGLGAAFRSVPGPGNALADAYEQATSPLPDVASVDGFYDWVATSPGLAGFNHPNLYGDFEDFKLDPRVVSRVVSIEAINDTSEYLFWDAAKGKPDPINACLNAGWRVGLLGVTDEHSTNFGGFDDKGRGGLWVRALTRDGVHEALASRRFFATRERGLRLDASANGERMGSGVALPGGAGVVSFALDIDKAGWTGKRLSLQVLRPGPRATQIAWAGDVTVPGPAESPVSIEVPMSLDEGAWTFLRLSDRGRAADPQATPAFAPFGLGVAYSSPWWLAAS